jgi:hypothetical protein
MNYPYQFQIGDEVFPFGETLHDENEEGVYDYHYDVSVVWEGRDGEVVITRWGVSLWFDDGDAIMTNIQPASLFPNKRVLTIPDLIKVMKTLVAIGGEGMSVSKEKLDHFYQHYLREVKE